MGWAYLREFEAQQWFGRTHVYMDAAPIQALRANERAYRLAPWDRHIRHQFYATLMRASLDANVQLDPRAADRVFETSKSAGPYSPMLWFHRCLYILRAERTDLGDELKWGLEWLRDHAIQQDRVRELLRHTGTLKE